MALIYLEDGHLENMRKCWDKFIAFEEDKYTRGNQGYWLFSKLNEFSIPDQNRPNLSTIKADIIYMLEEGLSTLEVDGDQQNAEFIKKKMELINNTL